MRIHKDSIEARYKNHWGWGPNDYPYSSLQTGSIMQTKVKEHVVSERDSRNVGIALLTWATLPSVEVLKADETHVVIRSYNHGLISLFDYKGTPENMRLHYEFAEEYHRESIRAILGYHTGEHLMAKILVDFLQRNSIREPIPEVTEDNHKAMILGLSYVAVELRLGDAANVVPELTKQLKWIEKQTKQSIAARLIRTL